MVIDLPSDKGLTHFYAVSRLLNLPEFVKQADFTTQVETNDLPREAFADPLDKKFPIHTKEAAYLSYAYFLSQKTGMDKKAVARCVEGFIKANDYWGLNEDFKSIEKDMTPKVQVKEGRFALKYMNENLFPLNTPSEIMKSAFELENTRSGFDYPLRSQVAKNIMKAASEMNQVNCLPEAVHKMAGCGITTKEAAMVELTTRWNRERRPSLAEPLHTCIEALSGLKSDLIGGEVCEKIAAIIDRYDHLTAGKTTFPEDVLFAFTKQAADKIASGLVSMVDGTSYWLNELEKAADAFNVLGTGILNSIKNLDGSLNPMKIAELVDTLPRIDAEILKDSLNTLGIRPVALDKHAMVHEAVKQVQDVPGWSTSFQLKIEKRANVLERLESQDPLVKRAMDVVRRLKTAEASPPIAKGTSTPRGLKGLFANKAPNSTVAVSVK